MGLSGETTTLYDRCNLLGTEIRVAFAPKGLDLFEPFLRGFVTVHRLLSPGRKGRPLELSLGSRPEAVLDRSH